MQISDEFIFPKSLRIPDVEKRTHGVLVVIELLPILISASYGNVHRVALFRDPPPVLVQSRLIEKF